LEAEQFTLADVQLELRPAPEFSDFFHGEVHSRTMVYDMYVIKTADE